MQLPPRSSFPNPNVGAADDADGESRDESRDEKRLHKYLSASQAAETSEALREDGDAVAMSQVTKIQEQLQSEYVSFQRIHRMLSETMQDLLDFNIDKYLNSYIPHPHLNVLPEPISHVLGYRPKPARDPPILVQWALMVISTISGLSLVAAIYNYAPGIAKYNPPVLVASLGASAVLDYNTIYSPLAQPRNTILGHTLSAIVGVAVSKLFQLNSDFDSILWITGAVGCAAASLVMSMTNTVHPPGGATAVLACTNKQVLALGWMFVPLILLASLLMTTVACLFNNTLRQYPMYWWTPENVGEKLHRRRRAESNDLEGGDIKTVESSNTTASERTLAHELSHGGNVGFMESDDEVYVASYKIRLPAHVQLSNQEVELLENVQQRLRRHTEIN